MVGEGLGRVENTDAVYDALFDNQNPEVVGIGDVIVDKMVDLACVPDEKVAEWERSDWFPEPGESVKVADVPEIGGYVEDELPGGRSTNQALAAYRAGANTGFTGRSTRPLSEELKEIVYDLEVFSDAAADAYVFVDETGENRITCTKTRDLTDEEYIEKIASSEDLFEDAEYLLVSNGESDEMLHSLFCTLEEYETDVIFDPAPADGAEAFLDYESLNYVTPNESEYEQLKSELERTDATVIQTSSDGAVIDQEYSVEAPDVEPVDTTGAGDTFNGYLAGCLAEDMNVETAMEYAVNAASLSVTEHGAQAGIPCFDEVERYMEADI